MENRSVELSISADDYVKAVQIHVIGQYARGRRVIVCVVAIYIALLILMKMVLGQSIAQGLQWPLLSMIAVFGVMPLLLLYVFVPWNARRNYRQQKSLHRPTRIEWSQDGFTTLRKEGRWTTPWADFLRVIMHKDMVLLYLAPNLFHVIPTRALSEEELSHLKEHAARIEAPGRAA